jgi:hypothetical protein
MKNKTAYTIGIICLALMGAVNVKVYTQPSPWAESQEARNQLASLWESLEACQPNDWLCEIERAKQ